MQKFTVQKEMELMPYLAFILPKWSRKEIKQYLTHGSISVNDQVTTRYDYKLRPNDIVNIASEKESHLKNLLEGHSIHIIYEDNDVILVDKPSGLLTIANETTSNETLYYKVTDYIRTSAVRKNARVFIVHRLDKDASGIVLLAKNEKAKVFLQEHWDDVKKKYYAIVEGCPKEKSAEIKSLLVESGSFRVHSTFNRSEGKLAITHYKVLKTVKDYSLLEINLITGRKNQIRVHLSEEGCPIIGDKKYDAETNPIKRLGLHAYYISFVHPVKKEKMTFQIEMPHRFKSFITAWEYPVAGYGV
jgi:23S rRNA pseudouridine1911/1915/1917 synthase